MLHPVPQGSDSVPVPPVRAVGRTRGTHWRAGQGVWDEQVLQVLPCARGWGQPGWTWPGEEVPACVP